MTAIGRSHSDSCPYLELAKREARYHLMAGAPLRTTRFVPQAGNRRGVVLLVDAVPTPWRAAAWRCVIREVEARGVSIAAHASEPQSGPRDGAVEVLAIFACGNDDECDFEAVWADALTAEGGQS